MVNMTPLEEIRHSCSHILATAVLRLFPDAQLDIGPPTNSGFYYDFDLEHKFTAEDLEAIEVEMKKVIKENQRFERVEVPREEAAQIIKDFGQDRYKLGRLEDIPEGDTISFYRNGEFIDLCAGTHVNYTKKIKAYKLLSIAGAYHRGDEKNAQLQRIYGTAFPSKDELAAYLAQLEEARQRDHRKIGKDMGLFEINDKVGLGLVLWKPAGATIRQELQDFIGEELTKQGYDQVFTPHIGKLDLYRTSGHFPYYKDSQFAPILEPDDLQSMADEGCACSELVNKLDDASLNGFLLKPMNCPMHIQIYDSEPRSYRDLPVRLAEFGTVYRWEQSGELNGMTRVRGFTQDDAHLFVTPDQLAAEIKGCLHLAKVVLSTLGMDDYRVRVSLRDSDSSKYIGDPADWDKAENDLRDAAKDLGVPYTEELGEAAFYGPKIDFVVKDVIGREWQLGTVQVDYNLPERFGLHYTGADNQPHRPIMIHRAPFGSMERFVGVLIEHFAGNFPLWLAPEQVRILPISEKFEDYAQKIHDLCKSMGLRATTDLQSDKLGAKIRRAETSKVPYMIIAGQKEAESETLSLRSRIHKSREGTYTHDEFAKLVQEQVANRDLPDPEAKQED
jgi:threonyl-tRNA synthetase